MNTNALKKFAQEARKKLIQQVGAKLEYLLTADTPELREKATQIKKLREALDNTGKAALIEKVAYTWFNRFMALRFMDANDYQPTGIRIVSPKDGYTLPELLDEAKRGSFPGELKADSKRVLDILDGRIPSSDPQNEAYRILLVDACNALHVQFPFLFEKINDYTELLLPDDLTSEFSILHDVVQGMPAEDCQQVEIIGWLYQFYISDVKDKLINAKKRYQAHEIAPVTQLFTPKWIVQYMVDNTLGQLWSEARPSSKMADSLEFYIRPHDPALVPNRKVNSPEDITFFDPCVGSAHVLCYAFDIFYKMYEEEGYEASIIPELIITKNLFGIDIDDRAAQLAGFALMMKGRQRYRRFLRKSVSPNITAFQNIESHPKFEHAKVLGSLIKISKKEVEAIKVDSSTLFGDVNKQLKLQASFLSNEYDIIVTNPPYLNSSYMEGTLKQYIEKEYKDTKSDLFACFLAQVTHLAKKDGLIGFICPYVWMFIKSYEWLREYIIHNNSIASLIQLEYNAFGPAVVPIGTFVLRNQLVDNYKGSYIKLSDFKGVDNQAPKTLEAIQNPDCGWFYTANQKDFEKIPGSPIGYWVSKAGIDSFDNFQSLHQQFIVRSGVMTGNDTRFLSLWYENVLNKIGFHYCNVKEIDFSKHHFFPMNKEEGYRKWSGRYKTVFRYVDNGKEFMTSENLNYRLRDQSIYFQKGTSWGDVTSGKSSFRFQGNGLVFAARAPMLISSNTYITALLNSKISEFFQAILNPTLSFNLVDLERIPFVMETKVSNIINNLTSSCIEISQEEWKFHENSWGFQQNELIRIAAQDLEESYDLYQQYWKNKFHQLHQNEEELNRQFIEIYGLQDELTPDVPLEDITILKEETRMVNGELVFNAKEVFAQFVSYSVGCMFGRYSLDKEGLILANQGETLEDYLQNIEKSEQEVSFLPDDDNIIPVLDDEWFEDDIVGRFYTFLKVTFGEKDFQKNLTFLEEQLGKDIRKYFSKDFYSDHIKRYKKRPIYWMFSSPQGYFTVLIYMHRYTPDTLNNILNNYLRDYIQKLSTRREHFVQVSITGSATEKTKAIKDIDTLDKMLIDCRQYERDILYPLATERIPIDLDDGVLVNYNKFGNAIKAVPGLNDKATKDKVKGFDWIDTTQIR